MSPEERKILYETNATVQTKLLPDIKDTKDTLQRIEGKLESCIAYDAAQDPVVRGHSEDIKELQAGVGVLEKDAYANHKIMQGIIAVVSATVVAVIWAIVGNIRW